MDQIKIGKFIAQLRTEQGMTQKELAEKLSISDKTVSKWECGRGLPEVSLMTELCQQLGVSINELLSGQRLDETQYRQKAEENMTVLMKEKTAGKLVLHFAFGVLLFLAVMASYLLAGGQVIPPMVMTVTTFWCLLLSVGNMIAVATYGIMKRFPLWKILLIAVADGILILFMIFFFAMQLIVWYAV